MSQGQLELDMTNRDPNNLNDHVKISFEEVLGEPDGIRSADCVWRNSYQCFEMCKGCCYKLLTAICGIPLAICWGCEFAGITFHHVWCVTPCMRSYMINCGCMQKFYSTCLQCFVQPCCEAFSFLFHNIKVTKMSG